MIKVFESAVGELEIAEPSSPVSGVHIGVLAVLVVMTIVALFAFRGTSKFKALIPGAGLVILGLIFLSRQGESWRMTLSRHTGKMHSVSLWFGREDGSIDLPIEEIRYATLQYGRGGAARLVLVTQSGKEVVPMNQTFTVKEGFLRARDAVNGFLGAAEPSREPQNRGASR